MDLASRIRAIRKEKKLTQAQLGELVNMSQRSVASWEAGDRAPSYPVLCELADKLHVQTDYLLGRTDNKLSDKPTTYSDDELREMAIQKVQALHGHALDRVLDFLSGLEAGQETGSALKAVPAPDSESS